MKRILACLVLAVAVAGCGSDELDAAQQRIEELEAELAATTTTLPATTTTRPATTTTRPATTTTVVPGSSAGSEPCEVVRTSVTSGQVAVYWEVSFQNLLNTRSDYFVEVDIFRDGRWIQSGQTYTGNTPAGETATADSLIIDKISNGYDVEYTCEVFFIGYA